LEDIQKQFPQALVWGEGDAPAEINALTRQDVHPAQTLVIWTAPPSQATLQEVIQKIAPSRIVVFGKDPNLDAYIPFMQRLAGLAKFTANQKAGQASLQGLAAACAAEEETIQVGLLLWQALGELSIAFTGEELNIRIVKGQPDPSAIETYQPILISLLEEIRAYRGYFNQMDLDSFLLQ
jgi:hypothetical protein